jgi:hypothetical protein
MGGFDELSKSRIAPIRTASKIRQWRRNGGGWTALSHNRRGFPDKQDLFLIPCAFCTVSARSATISSQTPGRSRAAQASRLLIGDVI